MNPRSLVITGGIGSGKSTLAMRMEGLGATRIDLDLLGHQVLATDEGTAFVTKHWPAAVVRSEVDRTKLGALVFSDPPQLSILEGFIHPRVRGILVSRMSEATGPVVIEASVPDALGDRPPGPVVVVDAPLAARRERLLRRGMTEEDVASRIRSQPDRTDWLALADIVVSNAGTPLELDLAAQKLWDHWKSSGSPPGSGSVRSGRSKKAE
jgi:dephospho-CoA kinase